VRFGLVEHIISLDFGISVGGLVNMVPCEGGFA
jgi:hypothetical protein